MLQFERKSTHNFYESFSDLLFNTVKLLLVVVLFLTIRVASEKVTTDRALADATSARDSAVIERQATTREAEGTQHSLARQRDDAVAEVKELRISRYELARKLEQVTAKYDKAVGDKVFANRFTAGATGRSQFLIATVKTAGTVRFAFIPTEFDIEYHSAVAGEEPAAQLARQKKLRQELVAIYDKEPETRLFSAEEMRDLMRSTEPYWLHGRKSAISRGVRQSQLYSAFLSHQADLETGTISTDADAIFTQDKENFKDWKGLVHDLIERDFENSVPRDSSIQQPILVFDLDDVKHEVIVGQSRFSPARLKRYIFSISGAPLILEYRPASGVKKTVPQWFVDEVLKPTGYTNRVPETVLQE